jgi:hypothetical protein
MQVLAGVPAPKGRGLNWHGLRRGVRIHFLDCKFTLSKPIKILLKLIFYSGYFWKYYQPDYHYIIIIITVRFCKL